MCKSSVAMLSYPREFFVGNKAADLLAGSGGGVVAMPAMGVGDSRATGSLRRAGSKCSGVALNGDPK